MTSWLIITVGIALSCIEGLRIATLLQHEQKCIILVGIALSCIEGLRLSGFLQHVTPLSLVGIALSCIEGLRLELAPHTWQPAGALVGIALSCIEGLRPLRLCSALPATLFRRRN